MTRALLIIVILLKQTTDFASSESKPLRIKNYRKSVERGDNDSDVDVDDRIVSALKDVIIQESDNDKSSRITESFSSRDTTALKKVFQALSKRQRKTPSVTRRSERGREGRPQRSELGREGRQLVSRQGDEDCETSYRTEIRPECTTVTETICSNVTVIRTRPDIKENCTTRIDQKCRPTKAQIPEKKCSPKYDKRCEHRYKTVEEKSYKEECAEEIRHVCEEKIVYYNPAPPPPPSYKSVPRPPPPHPTATPQPIFTPTPHPYSGPLPSPSVTITPRGAGHLNRRQKRNSEAEAESRADGEAQPQLSMFNLMFKSGQSIDEILNKNKNLVIKKTPKIMGGTVNLTPKTTRMMISEKEMDEILTKTQLDKPKLAEQNILDTENLFTNIISFDDQVDIDTGSVGDRFPATTSSPFSNVLLDSPHPVNNVLLEEETLEDRVRKAMINVLSEIPGFGNVFAKDRPHIHNPAIQSVHEGIDPHEHLIHAVTKHPLKPYDHDIEHPHELGGRVIHHDDPDHHYHFKSLHHHPTKEHPHHHHLGGPVVHQVPHPILHQPPPPPPPTSPSPPAAPAPTITIVELPADPGCRSFSTKTCHKVPVVVPKRVPYDECRAVPSVECFFVIKTVDDLECTPVSYEDCNREAIEVPFIDSEEVCEDVDFEDCVDAEVQVPIKICKEVDPNREPIVNREIAGTQTKTRSRSQSGGSRGGSSSSSSRGRGSSSQLKY